MTLSIRELAQTVRFGLKGYPQPDAEVALTALAQVALVDQQALDRINDMLSDPEWGVGMLEDICAIVRSTGREDNPDAEPWARH